MWRVRPDFPNFWLHSPLAPVPDSFAEAAHAAPSLQLRDWPQSAHECPQVLSPGGPGETGRWLPSLLKWQAGFLPSRCAEGRERAAHGQAWSQWQFSQKHGRRGSFTATHGPGLSLGQGLLPCKAYKVSPCCQLCQLARRKHRKFSTVLNGREKTLLFEIWSLPTTQTCRKSSQV